MPNVTIEVRRRYSNEHEAGIVDPAHAAPVEGINTSECDRTIRLSELDLDVTVDVRP